VTFYVQVPDVAAALDRVVALGAEVVVPQPPRVASSLGSSAIRPATGSNGSYAASHAPVK
jgi:hypothetical protein